MLPGVTPTAAPVPMLVPELDDEYEHEANEPAANSSAEILGVSIEAIMNRGVCGGIGTMKCQSDYERASNDGKSRAAISATRNQVHIAA